MGDNDNAGDYAVFCVYYDLCGCGRRIQEELEDAGVVELRRAECYRQLKPTRESTPQGSRTVCTDREGMYGSPEDNFRLISDLWSNYLNAIKCEWLALEDVAVMIWSY